MFFKKKDTINSTDRMDNSVYNTYKHINFYGMFCIKTKRYFIFSSLVLFFFCFYWLGFVIILLCNWIQWEGENRANKWDKTALKRNDIIKEEFTHEIWWCRSELNIFNLSGSVIKDFSSFIQYSNQLFYYDFINNGLFYKSNIQTLNNKYCYLFVNKYVYNKKYNNINKIKLKKKDYIILSNINKTQLLFTKNNMKNYLKNNINIINYLNSKLIYKSYPEFIFINNNKFSFKNTWWSWLNKIIK